MKNLKNWIVKVTVFSIISIVGYIMWMKIFYAHTTSREDVIAMIALGAISSIAASKWISWLRTVKYIVKASKEI